MGGGGGRRERRVYTEMSGRMRGDLLELLEREFEGACAASKTRDRLTAASQAPQPLLLLNPV